MTKAITFLTVGDVRDICFALARRLLTFDEPIPDFDTRFPCKLEAILEIPQQGTKEGLLYSTLTGQATVLFYALVKEHPFLNGRILWSKKDKLAINFVTFCTPGRYFGMSTSGSGSRSGP
jgi:hypothetical protein